MDSQLYIGRPGVPMILIGAGPLEVRRCLQPQNDREEYLLAMLEETALSNTLSDELGRDYEDGDDTSTMLRKLSLREERDSAMARAADMLARHNKLKTLVRETLNAQGLIASQDDRMQAILDGLQKISAQFGIRD